jgi:predicted amidohydrolase
MRAACIQLQVKPCCMSDNLHRALNMAKEALARGADLLVFPELFLTGFCYDLSAREAEPYPSLDPFRVLACQSGCTIIGSLISGRQNLGFCLDPQGEEFRAKIHPFGPEREHFDGGEMISPISTHLGKIGLEICYDLRFPEVARALALQGSDYLVTIAQFPLTRRYHWRALAVARAIENQIPHIACNCSGPECCGSSMIIDAWGDIVSQAGDGEALVLGDLDPEQKGKVRKEIACFQDRRSGLY